MSQFAIVRAMRDGLLILHIIGVAIWLGGNVTQAFVGSRISAASTDVRLFWATSTGAMARVLYNVAGILVLITGIALVLDSDFIDFSEPFIGIGFLAVIIGAVLGMAVFGPGSRQLAAAITSGDAQAEAAVNRKLTTFGIIDTLVVVVTIGAMVGHWGLN
ncbi:hypothetical protein BH10ACT3_BH10ACT3_05320 [soil metagenome]